MNIPDKETFNLLDTYLKILKEKNMKYTIRYVQKVNSTKIVYPAIGLEYNEKTKTYKFDIDNSNLKGSSIIKELSGDRVAMNGDVIPPDWDEYFLIFV